MLYRLSPWAVVVAAWGLTANPAAAQVIVLDGIYTTANPDKPAHRPFTITGESPRGLTIKEAKAEIPAETIADVVFLVEPQAVNVGPYRAALNAEREARLARTDADRTKKLGEALAGYGEALAKLGPGQDRARAHLQFKAAEIRYQQARQSGQKDALDPALKQLDEFRGKHKDAWQTSRVLVMLAQGRADLGRFAEAEKTYRELAAANVPDAVKQDAEVQALMIAMRAGRFAEAQTKLQALVGSLPKGSKQQFRARLALAECLGMAKDLKKAGEVIKQVLADPDAKDKQIRALAHNVMGHAYYLSERWQDARWEFLWVDVVYNQDKAEHAKALYFLADIFARLGEGERARECLDLLRADPQLAATDYARRPPPGDKQ